MTDPGTPGVLSNLQDPYKPILDATISSFPKEGFKFEVAVKRHKVRNLLSNL